MIGVIKFFNADRGYGFISPEAGGKDVFVHASALGGLATLQEGDRVSFETEPDKRGKGLQAVNVKRA
jgi:CspA family cold shock protein